MADIVKINTVESANIVKVNGVARANFSKVLGQNLAATSTYSSVKSLEFDATNEYAYAALPNSWGKSQGSYSVWLNLESLDTDSRYLLSFTDNNNNSQQTGDFSDFYTLHYFHRNATHVALIARARHTISGNTYNYSTVALTSDRTTYDGTTFDMGYPYYRKVDRFDDGDSGDLGPQLGVSVLNGSDVWTHVVVTWDYSQSHTYTPPGSTTSTSYQGTTKIYINGTLRNIGQGDGMPGNDQQADPTSLTERTNDVTHMYVGSISHHHTKSLASYDGIGIWSTALDANNVAAIYNSGNPTDLSTNSGNYNNSGNLVGYWKMDSEVSVDSGTVEDSSNNSNTLNLVNSSALTTNVPTNSNTSTLP